ncbi:unnamed protein product [Closterium sp. NIES-53]
MRRCSGSGALFYHPTSCRVLSSTNVTFDESDPFYRLFPYRSAPPPPPPLFLAPDPLPGTVPVEVAGNSGAAPGAASGGDASGDAEPGCAESEGVGSGGAEPGGAEPRGAEPAGVEPGGAEPEGVEPGGAESEGAESGGAEPRGAASSGGPASALPRLSPRPEPLSPQQLCEWLVWRASLRSGAAGAGALGDTGAGGARDTAGAGGTGGAAAAAGDPMKPGAAWARGTGAGGTSAGGAGAGGAGAGGNGAACAGARGARARGTGAGGAGAGGAGADEHGAGGARAGGAGGTGAGGTVRPRPYFVPLLRQSGDLTERRKHASRPASPIRTGRRVPRLRPPPVPSTHAMTLRPSSVPLRVPLPPPPESALPASTTAFALVAELLDFAVACRLDNATALVAESMSTSPPSVGGEYALDADDLEDRQEDFDCLAAAVPRFASMLHAPEGDADAPDIPTPRSYAEAITVPQSRANIVDGMWIFRMKRPPGSPPAFKAGYVARGFRQRQGVDYFHTFSPTLKMTTLLVLLHVAAQRDYDLRRPVYGLRQAPREWHDALRTTLAALEFSPSTADLSLFLRTDTSLPLFYVLVYIDDLVFATAQTEALTLVKSELARRTITLTQSHMVHQVLQRFAFQFSWPQPTPLSTSHSLSAPPSDESVEPSGPYTKLVGCLMYLMTCTRPDLAYPLSLLARYVAPSRHQKVHWDAAKRVLRYLCSTLGMGLVLGGRGPVVLTGDAEASWVDDSATQRSSQGFTFSLGSSFVSWRSTHSSSVLSSSCEAEIYAGAMAAQELRWLTYLLTDLGEQPCSHPVVYVDNKAMISLCQEHRLEHITKHIALRYFLARELQQRGQLRLAYVATRANTADIFTMALPPGDHQRFCTVLGLVPTLPDLLSP